MYMDKALKTMKRRLERLELEHLRQHALELHERLEIVERELEETRALRRLLAAGRNADARSVIGHEFRNASKHWPHKRR